ncbi:kinase-like domain-containing protein [Mucidula mucida]|nr:kinase-like domain-containing protein [Mucidula mucida]
MRTTVHLLSSTVFTFVGEPQFAGQVTPPTPPSTVPSTPDPNRSTVSAPFGHRNAVPHGPPSVASTHSAPQSGYIDLPSTYSHVDLDLCRPLSSLQASQLPISSSPHVSLIKGLPDNIYFKTKCYQFNYLIGEGNFARVFHARRKDVLTGVTKLVAIKMMNKVPTEKAVNWSLGNDLPGEEVQWTKCRVSNRELVIREKELLGVLGHTTSLPFLSSLFEAFQDNHFVYFVVPLCLQSLHDLMNGYRSRGSKIPDNELKRYAAELLLGIENLHSLGWYHHDIKPDNIMISGSGHIQLVDFGCVQKGFREGHGLRELGPNDLLGARACQSPELIRQRYHQQNTGNQHTHYLSCGTGRCMELRAGAV